MSVSLSMTARIVLGIYVPSALVGFAQGMIVPTVPALAAAFDVPAGLASQIVTAQLVGRTSAMIPSGLIVDRLGRKHAMIGGSILAIGAALAATLAPSFVVLLLAVGLIGFGETVWAFGREIAAIDQVRPEQRGRMMGSFFGVGSVGVAFGPVAGGMLTDWVGFWAVFAAFAAVLALVLALALSIKERPGRVRTAARSGFSFRILREVDPLYRPTFLVLMFSTLASMLRSTALHAMLPIYAGVYLGFSSADVGVLFGISGLVMLLAIGPAGYLSDNLGRKWAVVPAASLAGIGFIAFFLARDLPGLWIASVIVGFSAGLATGSNSVYTYDIIPEGSRGRFQAVRRSVGEIGAFGGPLLGGLIAGASHAGVSFLVFAPLHLASALLLAFVARESHERRRAARPVSRS
jgi:MFS family permease